MLHRRCGSDWGARAQGSAGECCSGGGQRCGGGTGIGLCDRWWGSGGWQLRGGVFPSSPEEVQEGLFAEVGQVITGIKVSSFLTPNIVSKNYAIHGIRLS